MLRRVRSLSVLLLLTGRGLHGIRPTSQLPYETALACVTETEYYRSHCDWMVQSMTAAQAAQLLLPSLWSYYVPANRRSIYRSACNSWGGTDRSVAIDMYCY